MNRASPVALQAGDRASRRSLACAWPRVSDFWTMVLIRPVHVSSAVFFCSTSVLISQLFHVRTPQWRSPCIALVSCPAAWQDSSIWCPFSYLFIIFFGNASLFSSLESGCFSKYVAAVQDDLSKLGLVPGDNRRHFLLLFGFTLKQVESVSSLPLHVRSNECSVFDS